MYFSFEVFLGNCELTFTKRNSGGLCTFFPSRAYSRLELLDEPFFHLHNFFSVKYDKGNGNSPIAESSVITFTVQQGSNSGKRNNPSLQTAGSLKNYHDPTVSLFLALACLLCPCWACYYYQRNKFHMKHFLTKSLAPGNFVVIQWIVSYLRLLTEAVAIRVHCWCCCCF